ncbi:hypothetical protein BJY04DRAFT_187269 [Aspergillus karnatakaensis]|uniref:uncharacterized protein n=1 Tax=Aspergillus karnatakaensis TaxID=1810916 RepID=UPI003CCDBB88
MARGKFPKLREILLDQHSRLNNHLQVLALFEAVGVHFGYSSQWELGESIYVQIRQLTEPCLEPETWSLPEPEDISDL